MIDLSRVTIICVGRIKEKYWKDAIDEYTKRLSRYCRLEIVEVQDEKTPENAPSAIEDQIREKEGVRISKYLDPQAAVFALAIEGKKFDSPGFARQISRVGVNGQSHIQFIIGGSLGLPGHGLWHEELRRRHRRLLYSTLWKERRIRSRSQPCRRGTHMQVGPERLGRVRAISGCQ